MSRTAFRSVVLFVFLVIVGQAKAEPKDVVQLRGSVDEFRGSYGTSVGFEIPSFHGLEPHIGLTYNSSAGNGSVGVGWNLSGIPTISRVSLGKGAPKFDATDIFLLDGEELIPCSTPGLRANASCSAGGTHTTKDESYSRVVYNGATDEWTVTSTSGTSSVFPADWSCGAGKVVRYSMQRRVDTHGNRVNIARFCDSGQDCYPVQLTYAPRSGGGDAAVVTFYWDNNRTDVVEWANTCTVARTDWRLKAVGVQWEGQPLRAYSLQYAYGYDGASLLTSVQQFGEDAVLDASGSVTNAATASNLPAQTFSYDNAGSIFASVSATDMGRTAWDGPVVTGDFDGDGKEDMVRIEAGPSWPQTKVHVYKSQGDGSFTALSTNTAYTAVDRANTWLPADLNGDGKTDLVEIITNVQTTPNLWAFLSKGDGTFDVYPTTLPAPAGQAAYMQFFGTWKMGDVDGDGVQDLYHVYHYPAGQADVINVLTWNQSTKTFGIKASNPIGVSYDDANGQWLSGDFNGDGSTDLLHLNPSTQNWDFFYFTRNGSFTMRSWRPSPTYSNTTGDFFTGDFNGDGKTDVLHRISGDQTANIFLSTGDTFGASPFILANTGWQPWPGYGMSSGSFQVMDMNGDGLADIVHTVANTQYANTFLSKGDGTFSYSGTYQPWANYGMGDGLPFQAIDVDGDGRPELLHVVPGVSYVNVWMYGAASISGHKLRTVANGFGSTTSIAYGSSVNEGASYNNPPSVWVVKSVTTSIYSPLGNTGGSTRYSYAGGRYDFAERRFLGFLKVTTTAPQLPGETSAPTSVTDYEFPVGQSARPVHTVDMAPNTNEVRTTDIAYVPDDGLLPHLTQMQQRTTAVDWSGHRALAYVSRTYDVYGNILAESALDGSDWSQRTQSQNKFIYNIAAYIVSAPNKVSTLDANNNVVADKYFAYDNQASGMAPIKGDVTAEFHWLNTGNRLISRTKGYDAYGNVAWAKDALGNQVTYAMDTDVNLFPTSQTNALGHTTRQTWDTRCAVPLTSTDANGTVTTTSYDALCRPSHKALPLGGTEDYAYVAYGQWYQNRTVTTTPVNAANPIWTTEYFDGSERTWRSQHIAGPTSAYQVAQDFTYNARGQIASKSDNYLVNSPGVVVRQTITTYDGFDRVVKITKPDGSNVSSSYAGWSVTTTDELGRQEVEDFDYLHRKIAHHQLANGADIVTRYAYDANGHLSTVTDTTGTAIVATFDSLGRRIQLVDPNTGTQTFTYDDNDNLVTQMDAQGQLTAWTYDVLGRKTSVVYGKNRTASSKIKYTWTYDSLHAGNPNIGRLTDVTDASGVVKYDYDAAGRVAVEVRTFAGNTFAFQYGYDNGGRLTSVTYPDNEVVTRTYDEVGRLQSIPGYINSISYDENDRPTYQVSANGVATAYQIDPVTQHLNALVTRLASDYTTVGLQNLSFDWDAGGIMRAKHDLVAGTVEGYVYDGLTQLTSAVNTKGGVVQRNLVYTYDNSGRMLSNSAVGAYSYAATSGAHHFQLQTVAGKHYIYDSAGNLLQGGGRTYTYDTANRVATISGTSAGKTYNLVFTYDAEGNRLTKTDTAAAPTNLTLTLPNGYEVAKLGPVTTATSPGNLGINSTVTKYISGPHGVAARKVFTNVSNTTTLTFLHLDERQSVGVETDGAGKVTNSLNYDPYGTLTSTKAIGNNQVGFTGGIEDNSGLVHLGSREYDPMLAQFTAADSLLPGEGVIALNRYAYCFNNPISWIDTNGHWPGFVDDAIDSVKDFAKAAAGAAKNYSNQMAHFVKDHWRGIAQVAVLATAVALTGVTFGAASGSIGAAVAINAAIGGMSALANAKIGGASWGDSFKAGVVGAAIGGATGGTLRYATAFRGCLDMEDISIRALSMGVEGISTVVLRNGEELPVPNGAHFSRVANNEKGIVLEGGAGGGDGMSESVTGMRIMEPDSRYPDGRVNYTNKTGQVVDPVTGRTPLDGKNNPVWHIESDFRESISLFVPNAYAFVPVTTSFVVPKNIR